MNWTYDLPQLRPQEPFAHPVATPVAQAQAPPSGPLTMEEIKKFRQQLTHYDQTPVEAEIANLVRDHQHDNLHLSGLVREFSAAVDGLQANPQGLPLVSRELAPVLGQIQKIEQQKVEAAMVVESFVAPEMPAIARQMHGDVEGIAAPRMEYHDLGDTARAIAAQGSSGFTPTNVPDVRIARGPEKAGGSRNA